MVWLVVEGAGLTRGQYAMAWIGLLVALEACAPPGPGAGQFGATMPAPIPLAGSGQAVAAPAMSADQIIMMLRPSGEMLGMRCGVRPAVGVNAARAVAAQAGSAGSCGRARGIAQN